MMDDYDLAYSYYDDEEEMKNYELEYESYDLYNSCITPTVRGISYHFASLLLWNLFFRISTQTGT